MLALEISVKPITSLFDHRRRHTVSYSGFCYELKEHKPSNINKLEREQAIYLERDHLLSANFTPDIFLKD